jgi:low temperature requirement protein LtrA
VTRGEWRTSPPRPILCRVSVIAVPFRRALTPRDPHEPGRAATPLELFFDLIFVVAIASNAAQLHHGITEGHLDAILGYTLSWFAIWWAWMGYTWYASAYDNDDVVFRLLTFVIMVGCLVLAAAIPDLFADGSSALAVAGYAIMRLGLVALWLRAAAHDPQRRKTAMTYAVGITLVQLLWIARLWVPESWFLATFGLLVILEVSVPWIAERRHGSTPFHPHHIAERYALLTIIVLGEVILSTVLAVQGAMASSSGDEGSGGHSAPYAAAASGGVGPEMLPLIVGGLFIVFSLWWLYFKRENVDLVEDARTTFLFGYAHLPVFASCAAVGAALAAAVDVVGDHSESSDRTVALVLSAAVVIFLLTLGGLHSIRAEHSGAAIRPAVVVSIAVLVVPFLGLPVQWSIMLVGLILAAAVAEHVVHSGRLVTA